jgi:hypothetical protein
MGPVKVADARKPISKAECIAPRRLTSPSTDDRIGAWLGAPEQEIGAKNQTEVAARNYVPA